MKKILSCCIIASMFFTSSASFAFDMSALNIVKNMVPSKLKNSSSEQTPFQNIDNKITNINTQVQNSFLNIVSILSSEQDAVNIKSQFNSILNNANSTQDEKISLINSIISNYTSNLANNKSDVISVIKNLSGLEQKNLSNYVYSLAKNSTQYLSLSKDYLNTASTLSKNISNLQETQEVFLNAKKTASLLSNSAIAVKNLSQNLLYLIKQAK